MEFYDNWSHRGAPVIAVMDRIKEVLEQSFAHVVNYADFGVEDKLPYVEVSFYSMESPAVALQICQDIQSALVDKPIFFHKLGPTHVAFLIQGDFWLPPGARFREGHFAEMGAPVADIARAWTLPTENTQPAGFQTILWNTGGEHFPFDEPVLVKLKNEDIPVMMVRKKDDEPQSISYVLGPVSTPYGLYHDLEDVERWAYVKTRDTLRSD